MNRPLHGAKEEAVIRGYLDSDFHGGIKPEKNQRF